MSSIRIRQYVGAVALCTALVFALTGCGGGGASSGGNGTLSIAMSDGPDPTISAMNVTITKVEANINGAWTPITSVPQSFHLLDLVKNEKLLGSADLPAGHYTQVRFFPSNMTVTDSTGTHPVDAGGVDQTGFKVNVDYDLTPNQITTVLLDFNVNKSLVKQGNGQYRLQPVIPAVVKVLSGTVSGTVTSGGAPVKGADVTATYTAGSSYAAGTQVNTSTTLSDGTFKVWALLPGTYTITVSYTDPATNTTKTATQTGVVVTANQNTDLGSIALP